MGLFLMGSNFKSEESNKMLRDSIKDTRIFSPPWIRGRVEQHKHAIKLDSAVFFCESRTWMNHFDFVSSMKFHHLGESGIISQIYLCYWILLYWIDICHKISISQWLTF